MENFVEILVEEPSMAIFLGGILPKILPENYVLNQNCFIRPHQGKQDLQKSIPRKARALQYRSNAKLIIIHDQDANDCIALKQQLLNLVEGASSQLPKLVRIACKELENWYLGDLAAIEAVYPNSKASSFSRKAKFRQVDRLNGSEEMRQLSKDFTKSHAAREIPKRMKLEANTSTSFQHFIKGIVAFLSR